MTETTTITAQEKWNETSVTYVPLGQTKAMDLTVNYVRKYVATKSKKGVEPTNEDIIQFMQLCQAQRLNPWVGDAYLLGFDNPDGTTTFTRIISHQALMKRAEQHPQYRGIESGILVFRDGADDLIERIGAVPFPGDTCIGGWARVYRADRDIIAQARVNLSVYNTGRSRWKKDPHGMIEKCAGSAALRRGFPIDLGQFYLQEEMDHVLNEQKRGSPFVVPSDETPEDMLERVIDAASGDDITPRNEVQAFEEIRQAFANAKTLDDCQQVYHACQADPFVDEMYDQRVAELNEAPDAKTE